MKLLYDWLENLRVDKVDFEKLINDGIKKLKI